MHVLEHNFYENINFFSNTCHWGMAFVKTCPGDRDYKQNISGPGSG